jgi:hypothetical protein
MNLASPTDIDRRERRASPVACRRESRLPAVLDDSLQDLTGTLLGRRVMDPEDSGWRM